MPRFLPLFFAILSIIGISLSTVLKVDHLPIGGDGLDNLKLGYHLAHYGVISTGDRDKSNRLMPSNIREPFPVWLNAAWINLIPDLRNAKSLDKLNSGKRLIYLKLQNIIYIGFTLLGAFVLCKRLIRPFIQPVPAYFISLITVYIIHASINHFYANTLLTEFHAAALIIWFLLIWMGAIQKQKLLLFVAAGFLLGLLMLTKGAFLYIGFAWLAFYFIYKLIIGFSTRRVIDASVIAICTALTILPWYIRNTNQIGVWEFTQRGPVVLLTRAYKSQMTDTEFKGVFYAYAPLALKKCIGNLTGFSINDRYDGGRLQRFTRFPAGDEAKREQGDEEGAISYYIKATTHYKNIHRNYDEKDPLTARLLTANQAKREALELIKSNITGHLRASLVYAWRGAWPTNTVDGRWSIGAKEYLGKPFWTQLIPFLGLLSMIVIFVTSLFKRHVELAMLSALGTGSFVFYSLFTHFIPRYSEMFIPVWIICFVYGFIQIVVPSIKGIKIKVQK